MPKSTARNANRHKEATRNTRHDPTKRTRQLATSRHDTRPVTIAANAAAKSSEQTVANKARLARLVALNARRDENASRIKADDQASHNQIHFADEIWLEIFSYIMDYNTLKKLHLVSKRFCNILSDPKFDQPLFRLSKDTVRAGPRINLRDVHWQPFLLRRWKYSGSHGSWLQGTETVNVVSSHAFCHWKCRRQSHRGCRGRSGTDHANCYAKCQSKCHAHTECQASCDRKCDRQEREKWSLKTTSIVTDSAFWPPLLRKSFSVTKPFPNDGVYFVTVLDYITCLTENPIRRTPTRPHPRT